MAKQGKTGNFVIATAMTTFVDKKAGIRYSAGDVHEFLREDFIRITNKNKKLLKRGKHNFGNGVCHPCNNKSNNK